MCKPKNKNKESDTRYYRLEGLCFIYATWSTSWFEARLFCKNRGAELATVNTVKMLKLVANAELGGGQYWVGLHRASWMPGYSFSMFRDGPFDIQGGGWDFSSRHVIFFSLFAQQFIFFKSKLQQVFYFFEKIAH